MFWGWFWSLLMPRDQSQTVIHEVRKGGTLEGLIRGLSAAVNALAVHIGDGLHAIALALSTPHDNSAEVQKQIDKYTQEIKSSTDALDSAVKANQPKQQ
jgi:hypothetical protein